MKPGVMRECAAVLTSGLLAMLWVGGCASEPTAAPGGTPAAVAPGKPLPTFAAAVEGYNKRVLPLDRLSARATIRLTYLDEKGEKHTEQPDGTLQIIRPNKLAIDLGKGGKKLFWFGSDDDRYWWLDLTDSDDRFAAVGRHDRFDAGGGAAARELGLPVRPLDLIVATGVVPLDPKALGTTQWSRDGQRLGIVAPLGVGARRGVIRVWVNPATMIVSTIELFDDRRQLILRADHEGDERVEMTRRGVPGSVGERPRIPARITVKHFESDSDIRISLSDARDGPISDKAFRLDELVRRLGVERVIDLDGAEAAAAPAGGDR